MPRSQALDKFIASMILDYDKWHDGVGYDLEALAGMTEDERREIVRVLRDRPRSWREIEALAEIDLPEARAEVDEAAKDHLSIDNRVAAARVQSDQGRAEEPIDQVVARELRNLNKIGEGSVRTLLLAETHPTDAVKQALLWASWNHTEVAMHCAALLCYLVGVTKEPFDWSMRPLFLRLGFHESYFTRKQAFDELCALVKMQIES